MARPRSSSISEQPPALRIALALAGAGAVVLLLPLLGEAAGIIGLVAIIAGTVLAAPYADRSQPPIASWWSLLAAGAIFALVGVALSYASDTVGGLLTALGGVLVVVGAAFALPGRPD